MTGLATADAIIDMANYWSHDDFPFAITLFLELICP